MRAELRAELRGAHVAASSSNISTILAKFEPTTVIGSAMMSTPRNIATTDTAFPPAVMAKQSP